MKRNPHSAFWVCLTLVLFVLSIPLSCNRSKPLAALMSKQGDVQRSESASPNAWSMAALGVTFSLGDAVRTAHAASATLSLEDDCTLQVRQDTTIRFLSQKPSKRHQAFKVESGQALLEVGNDGALLDTSFGVARIQGRSQIVLERSPQGLRFDVMVGKAQLEAADGVHVIEAGQSYVVNVGDAVVERDKPAATATAVAEDAPPPSATAAAVDPQAAIAAQVVGNGVRERPSGEKTFRKLEPGAAQLQPGSTLHVDSGSSVELKHGGATITLTGGDHVVQSGGAALDVQRGKASVTGAVRIQVPGGMIETTGQAVAAVDTLDRGRSHLRMDHGSATVTTGRGTTRVEAGQEVTLSPDGATKLDGRGLDYADLSLDVGESLTVHDPRPPTAVRFRFGTHCPAGGTLRVAPQATYASGQGAVAVALGIGRHDYALYCLSDGGPQKTPAASGTLNVVMDSGTRPVPTKPPATSVNIDGRKYTVMYQNQLPAVFVSWPNAPASSVYTLHVASRSGQRIYTTAAPSYSFRSGALLDGRHTMHFESNGRASRYTDVDIKFDNAAPQASLVTPVESKVLQGGEITITGTVQPGWSVEIGGRKVESDEHQRFTEKTNMPTEERAVAVRLTNPTRGTHVYLRRAARTND